MKQYFQLHDGPFGEDTRSYTVLIGSYIGHKRLFYTRRVDIVFFCSSLPVIHMNPQPGMPSYVPKRPTIWHKKEPAAAGLMEPGWAPHLSGQSSRQQPVSSARRGPVQGGPQRGGTRSKSPPINRVPQQMSAPSATSQERHEPPAWAGSLRRSGGVRMWEIEEGETLARGGAPAVGRRHSPPRSVSFEPVSSGSVSAFLSAGMMKTCRRHQPPAVFLGDQSHSV
jgi:hypothetical protein